jgi:hypothetical protein
MEQGLKTTQREVRRIVTGHRQLPRSLERIVTPFRRPRRRAPELRIRVQSVIQDKNN